MFPVRKPGRTIVAHAKPLKEKLWRDFVSMFSVSREVEAAWGDKLKEERRRESEKRIGRKSEEKISEVNKYTEQMV